ncbi:MULTISPECIES: hypothetical protein [Vibrio]|uniref:Uncharacterized protein n=1 Tax=Vibrio proteolyticus NBRC 13287 TaxID=1219065 RepID=U2ZIA0_VIBPR|nr:MULTISPECIES: hypothetical protein [Vibrio]NAW56471.1 hypothetical protein [Vibrio sp. V36_P2S2PM302]NAX22853.1 hypothetical protein [Vibrio sp. V39_P1S14PM300]NAX27358.1 hypothetical protein [Vibrio sp. V38_P2S17PM301]NAX29538.1 hypothetical protein [Vibrio sp. V37_P2S8PM304]GAD67406.1 hypothetical protein VPR01S_07_02050 [Vibrio proteolyticus NBRC 13287]
MRIRDRIEALEQQIYVACSEGDFDTVNMLENQLEALRGKVEHPFDDDPYALEGKTFLDDEW